LSYFTKTKEEITNKQKKEGIGQSIYYLPVPHFELEQFP